MEKNIEYKQKYLKYKQKYLEKKYGLYGGSSIAVLQQQQENRLSAMARQETNKRREDAKNISATPLVEIFRSTHNAIPGFIKKMEEKLDPSHLDYITNLKVTEFIALCESLDKGIEEAQKVLLTKGFEGIYRQIINRAKATGCIELQNACDKKYLTPVVSQLN